VPLTELVLDSVSELRAKYFNERRETGVINIGAAGRVVVDGSEYVLGTRESLYIGMGRATYAFGLARARLLFTTC
jgi:4-deoxy-L-threo-5-hexosulose-uronate ketol-isomerase